MKLSPVQLITAMCVAEVLTMLGFSSVAALLPEFMARWSWSNTEAGWIGGVFFIGYTAAVPVLVALTDRIDAKKIWLFSAGITVISAFGFAFVVDGFWSAMAFRGLAGVGLAGTYMPGLKALGDQVGGTHSRSIAWYTGSFGLGTGASYVVSRWLAEWGGWEMAFWVPGVLSLIAIAIVLIVLPSARPKHTMERPDTALLDFRPVLRNRSSLAYTLCYMVHNWELFALRAWIVAFLTYAAAKHGVSWQLIGAAEIAAVMTLIGTPASIVGNEWALKYGRRRIASIVMLSSAALCLITGFTSAVFYILPVGLALIHGWTVAGDSSTITAGAIGNAVEPYRGATMAMHSTIGFVGGIMGPLCFGLVLDAFGGESTLAWGMAFAHLGLIVALGPLIILLMKPDELPGDGAGRAGKA